MLTGNLTKKALEIWRASFGLEMTTFTVSLHLPRWCFESIWRIYEGDWRFAEYTTFFVADKSDDYRVTIDAYRGTAGDVLLSLSRPIRFVSGISVFRIMLSEQWYKANPESSAQEPRKVFITRWRWRSLHLFKLNISFWKCTATGNIADQKIQLISEACCWQLKLLLNWC